MTGQIKEKEWILLSSYLDGELNPREQARVEDLLARRPDFQKAYQSLKRTKSILHHAPRKRVPRNFTIPASMALPAKTGWGLRLVPALRLSSVAAALMSVFLFVSQLVPGLSLASMRAASPAADTAAVQSEMLAMEAAPAAAEESPPPVVYWNGPPPPPADGMGGAGIAPGCPDGRCGGAADIPYAGGMGGGDGNVPGFIVPEPVIREAAPPVTAPQAEPEALPQATPEMGIAALPAEPLTGTGPILGVAPNEQQGKVLDDAYRSALPLVESGQETGRGANLPLSPPLLAGLGLIVLAAGLLAAAAIVKKNSPR